MKIHVDLLVILLSLDSTVQFEYNSLVKPLRRCELVAIIAF